MHTCQYWETCELIIISSFPPLCVYFSVGIPFKGDYVLLRNNAKYKKIYSSTSDQFIVFADIMSKVNRNNGKVSQGFLLDLHISVNRKISRGFLLNVHISLNS